jgi:Domain of unknown function (DUF5916)/Carbohydrate family 9 binding domain-like
MKRYSQILLTLLLSTTTLFAGEEEDSVIVRKQLHAVRSEIAPRIDGKLDEAVWQTAEIAGDFRQNSPQENADPSFKTEVRVMYDDNALYIGAKMYDNHPDSIMRQLGARDDYLNADNFRMAFDTYNTQQDAFEFILTASGVQRDSRFSDFNYNAVWKSEVTIVADGWIAEIAIPWFALRFPAADKQIWGLQFTRNIQRKFEFDQWAATPKSVRNGLRYWGELSGLDGIQTPVRLSVTPYLTTIWQNDDRFGESKPSMSFSGGMDLKYGLNESFTLDMTLLPDFSQVRSDNVVKNLGPFEVQFQEQRPFFTEGTDLFSRGDIFYSRRIGKTPSNFYSAPSLTEENEEIIKNPTQSRLLNATKISGRTIDGLGIGVLNAFVDNTYAIARDTITGETRNILTEPRSNYNIFVFDKQLKNSSNFYVTNTNVVRGSGFRSANVTAAGFSLLDKNNNWNFYADGGVSNVLYPGTDRGEFSTSLGHYNRLGIEKTSGKVQFGINRQDVSRRWDCNDMGINLETNYSNNRAFISYSIFNPWKIFNFASFNLSGNYNYRLSTGTMTGINLNFFSYMQFRNFWSSFFGIEAMPIEQKDFYEPRQDGRYMIRPRMANIFGGLNSPDNKKLSGGFDAYLGTTEQIGPTIPANPFLGVGAYLTLRAGNRFSITVNPFWNGDYGDRGWVNTEDDGSIIIGRRELHNYINTINASYVFMRDMTITLTGRYYRSTGEYSGYYILQEDGTLRDYVSYGNNHNFNFDSFNMDLVYRWIFLPGSVLSISWKQNILSESTAIDPEYFHNFSNTLRQPQLNQISVRVLYFLDYNTTRNQLKKKKF